jgi:glycerol-3-phosphate dehydrogenase
MAEDAVNRAEILAHLPRHPCSTAALPLIQASPLPPAALLHPALPLTAGAVERSCREEMARSVEDVLARRSRCLLLDARAAQEVAPTVARLMAAELGRDAAWEAQQTAAFARLAAAYRV